MKHLELIDNNNKEQAINLHDFFLKNCCSAKGSSNNHQSWESGYFDHINEVLSYARNLYTILSRDRILDFSLSDVILVLFLHDIEKPLKYSNYDGQFKSDGDARDFLIKTYKFDLNEKQKNALKYIHGEGLDYKKEERIMNPLGAFCHCCDVISSRIFFNYPVPEERFKFVKENVIEHVFNKKTGIGYIDFTEEELTQLKTGEKFSICTVSYCKNKTIEKYGFRYCSKDCFY